MKMIKRMIALVIALSLGTISSFAAVVSDNDGAAFITKAEFDSLKNTFQSQINGFNSNIDNKIESAINFYISGVKQEKTSKIQTAFITDGKEKQIIFVGKANNFNNMSNTLYTRDSIFEIFAGTYQTTAYFMQDTYDTFCFEASYSIGNSSNYLFVLDGDKDTVLSTKKNVQMNCSRVYVAYSTTNAQNGIFWRSITQNLNTPTDITNQSSAYIYSTDAKGYGVRRNTQGDAYTTLLWEKIFSQNSQPKGFGISGSYYTNQKLYRTALETKDLNDVTKTCDVAISGTDVTPNLHWPTGSSYNVKTTNKEWGSKDLIKSYNSSRVNYTYTYKLKNAGGPVGLMECATTFTPSVKGYGLDWTYSNKSLSSVYYDGMNTVWNKKYSYSGGLPICHANKNSTVKLSLKSNTAVSMAFTTQQNTTFPSSTSSYFRKFKSKRSTNTDFVERTAPVAFVKDINYDFEISLNAGEDLFLTADMTSLSNTITITQIGDAYITEEG